MKSNAKFKQYQLLKSSLFQFDDTTDKNLLNRYADTAPNDLHPLVLAYVGDAYYHLYVRTRLLNFDQSHVQLLNDFSMQIVSAVWQARAYEAIKDTLTETELQIFKRAKNTKSHAPRSSSVHEYHISTGFEAVLGFLYLNKENTRLDELCEQAFISVANIMHQLHQQ